jgi:hypothetical protein
VGRAGGFLRPEVHCSSARSSWCMIMRSPCLGSSLRHGLESQLGFGYLEGSDVLTRRFGAGEFSLSLPPSRATQNIILPSLHPAQVFSLPPSYAKTNPTNKQTNKETKKETNKQSIESNQERIERKPSTKN